MGKRGIKRNDDYFPMSDLTHSNEGEQFIQHCIRPPRLTASPMPTKAPKCPWCAKPMSYVRTAPVAAGAHKHQYECKRCIVLYQEIDRNGERRSDRARKLDRELVRTLQ
jgi:hypothetical protein